MHPTGETPRFGDITGFVLIVYSDDEQPVLLALPTEARRLCPVFSSIEKADEAFAWMGVRHPTKPKRILDHNEFLKSFDGTDIMVAADPYLHNGNTRWTAIAPLPAE